MYYVAVVTNQDPTQSGRPDGALSCFVAEDEDTVIKQAIAAVNRWQTQYHEHDHEFAKKGSPYGPYRILVGELQKEALFNAYTLKETK